MTPSQKQILQDYAELKLQIKELEEKADELNPQILELMQESEVEEIAIGDIGKVSLGSRRSWKYTVKVQEDEKALKELKKLEEQTGAADYTEKQYIIFKSKKDE